MIEKSQLTKTPKEETEHACLELLKETALIQPSESILPRPPFGKSFMLELTEIVQMYYSDQSN